MHLLYCTCTGGVPYLLFLRLQQLVQNGKQLLLLEMLKLNKSKKYVNIIVRQNNDLQCR